MIPAFDHNGVMPPHLGTPGGASSQWSPYPITALELCQTFATSPQRIEILKHFLNFRTGMRKFGIKGFQWIGGSFVEDVENFGRKRSPQDLDLVTFFWPLQPLESLDVQSNFTEFFDRNKCKADYKLDHLVHNLTSDPRVTIEFVKYYIQLYTHNRDKVWKGILGIDAGSNSTEDDDANNYLISLS